MSMLVRIRKEQAAEAMSHAAGRDPLAQKLIRFFRRKVKPLDAIITQPEYTLLGPRQFSVKREELRNGTRPIHEDMERLIMTCGSYAQYREGFEKILKSDMGTYTVLLPKNWIWHDLAICGIPEEYLKAQQFAYSMIQLRREGEPKKEVSFEWQAIILAVEPVHSFWQGLQLIKAVYTSRAIRKISSRDYPIDAINRGLLLGSRLLRRHMPMIEPMVEGLGLGETDENERIGRLNLAVDLLMKDAEGVFGPPVSKLEELTRKRVLLFEAATDTQKLISAKST